jgi:HSP20 family protein
MSTAIGGVTMVEGRTDRFRGFLDMFTEMERMRRLGRTGTLGGQEHDPRTPHAAWAPSADIFADGHDLVIRLELPGVEPAEISVTFAGGVLTISGERRADLPDSTTFYVRERSHGPFERSMLLPEGIDESMITASFADGIAEVIVVGAARPSEKSTIPVQDRSSGAVTQVRARRQR